MSYIVTKRNKAIVRAAGETSPGKVRSRLRLGVRDNVIKIESVPRFLQFRLERLIAKAGRAGQKGKGRTLRVQKEDSNFWTVSEVARPVVARLIRGIQEVVGKSNVRIAHSRISGEEENILISFNPALSGLSRATRELRR